MRVLFVTMQFGPGYGQGTERYISILREDYAARGFDVQILAGDPDERFAPAEPGTPRDFDPQVRALPACGWMAIGGHDRNVLVGLLDDLRPDVLHVANPAHVGLNIVPAAASLGVPSVLTTMDFWWVCPKQTLLRTPGRDLAETCPGRMDWRTCLCCIANERGRSWRATLGQLPVVGRQLVPAAYLEAWRRRGLAADDLDAWPRRQERIAAMMNDAAAVIFPSQATQSHIAPLLDGPRAVRIPYGLESRWFQPVQRRDRPAARAALRIGYAGALAWHKGVHTLLDAVRQAGWHDVEVRIAGGGADDYVYDLRGRARDLNVTFCGRVPTERMPNWLAELDLLIMPSIWPENLPIITLEAAALGVPLIASDIEGVVELVPPEARFRPDDPRDLARCLQGWWGAEAWPTPPAVSTAAEMSAATRAVYEQVLNS